MTAIQKAVVDDLGNINVHGRAGLVITFKIETATEDVYENISASDLFFEVAGKVRVALTAGADNYTRQIVLTRAQVATLGLNQPCQFAVNDETPTNPRNLWAGTITSSGFRTAPTGADPVEGVAASYAGASVIVQSSGTGDPSVIVRFEGTKGDTGQGVPAGGTAGQVLAKIDGTDYNTQWSTPSGGGAWGSITGTLSSQTDLQTALNAKQDAITFGTGVLTFLGTPSSANLRAALTDETGTGAAVFATSPTLITPVLGTPASGNLSNCTALPLTTGVAGTLAATNGGTGLASFAVGDILYASTTSALSALGAGTATYVLTSNGPGVAPSWQAGAGGSFTGGLLTSVLGVVAGTVSAPGIYASGDTNTGVYFPAADYIALTTGGVKGLEQDASQRILIGGATATAQANIKSASTTRVSLIAQAIASQTADVFQATTSGGTVLAAIGAANGHMALNRASVSADVVLNIANGSNERVDTTGTAKGLDLILINALSGAMQGLSFAVESRYAGAVGSITGAQGYCASNNASNSITHARAFFANGPTATTSAGITNAYGFYAESQKATGVTNGYCFYGAGANDVMHVNGKVGIGITAPNANAKLDVDGAILFKVYTVATLPTPTNGLSSKVSDANSNTFNAAAVGGGPNKMPVFADGAGWFIG